MVLPIRMGELTQDIINVGVGGRSYEWGSQIKQSLVTGIKRFLLKWCILRFLIRKDLVGWFGSPFLKEFKMIIIDMNQISVIFNDAFAHE